MSELLKKRLELFKKIDIYPVITEKFCNGRTSIDVLKELIDADIKIVQLREKEKTPKEIYKLAEKFRKLTMDNNILLIIDDYIDIAISTGADGVHLGQDDFPYYKAKNLSEDILIGVSTHNLDEIKKAQENNISYINIGPIFMTQTKTISYKNVGLENLKKWIPFIKVPFTVMGGIKENNILELKKAGASRFAMVTEITQSNNISQKIKRLREVLKQEI